MSLAITLIAPSAAVAALVDPRRRGEAIGVYGLAVALLRELLLCRIRLMTNNPAKLEALIRDGVDVVERVPIERGRNPYNADYLDTKMTRMGHLIGARGES